MLTSWRCCAELAPNLALEPTAASGPWWLAVLPALGAPAVAQGERRAAETGGYVHRLTKFLCLVSCLASMTATAQTSATSERRFVLPEHGVFVLHIPRDWKDRLGQRGRLPPVIGIAPRSGRSFLILITPTWPASKDRGPQSAEELRTAVERGAQAVKPQAVESELRIVEFKGRSGPGFYFSATDRAPKPGEYRFVTQGSIRVGELSVSFTILTNDGQDAVVKQALEALKGASQERI